MILALSAIAPALLVMWYVHSRDVFPEPPRVIWVTFFLGGLAGMPAAFMEVPIDRALVGSGMLHGPLALGFAKAFVAAALPEEIVKFFVLRYYALRRPEFNEPMDGLVYGVAAAAGFAAVENFLYVTHYGMTNALMRAVTAVPVHCALGAIMGYFLGLSRYRPGRRGAFLVMALGIPAFLHGLYDFPVLAAHELARNNPWQGSLRMVSLVLAPVIFGFAIALIRRMQHLQSTSPTEAYQPYHVLDGYHGRGSGQRRAGSWVTLAVGGMLIWVGFLAFLGLANQGLAAATIVDWVMVVMALPGAAFFRRGITALNARRAG